jgi:hypothetical protein
MINMYYKNTFWASKYKSRVVIAEGSKENDAVVCKGNMAAAIA